MINFFDLGMYNGFITDDFLKIMNRLKIENYTVYGFEPYIPFYEQCINKYKNDKRIKILNLAVTNENKKEKIYKSSVSRGHSIFSDKNNIIDTVNFQEVDGILFSDWFNKNINQTDINLLNINIEGAEYYFFNDIIDSGTYKNITLFFGGIIDIKKIKSLSHKKYEEIKNKLNQHCIVIHSLHKDFDNSSKLIESIINGKQ